jgi:hypothetical protein
MWAQRGRTKKLIVAFHFQRSNQAAWKCDLCRKSGLEEKRRCGWLKGSSVPVNQIIWARRGVSLTTCPTSYVSPDSISLLEDFHAWKLFGTTDFYQLSARTVEAIFTLENELRQERDDGQQ